MGVSSDFGYSFISPAVVAPSIVDVELPTENTEVIRKGLMVIAKVIQNLANNIFFGKEQHMTGLNDFLKEHIVDITRYLSELNVSCLTQLHLHSRYSFGYTETICGKRRS